ncbi:MAG TPA: 1-deoxy-D-xylulose-5-phosphate reductoisomerase [Alcanivoracaceae bacterium]|nr:1-deoxy-D-xylulose-5-phosphate reductoisomerase [Alcanivoracaceae bacterium]
MAEQITLLGSTGSIGTQTLKVMAEHPGRYAVYALVAGANWRLLAEQCLAWQPVYAVLADEEAAQQLQKHLHEQNCRTEVLSGVKAMEQVSAAAEVDVVVAAIVGAVGVRPTLAAVQAGKRVLLANKEALVVTGQLFMDAVHTHQAELIPLDSEHNAIFQCLPQEGVQHGGVSQLWLTASGGPFRNFTAQQLATVTPAMAVKHPNWSMGQKISVDSASLMNKGLELIEACWLFDVPHEQVTVVVHPESVVHSMVEYVDGSVLAQLGSPDMRTPIAHALAWPERMHSGAPALKLTELAALHFEEPNHELFPSLNLAREALTVGGTATAILNAANEEAVAAFLLGELSFQGIFAVVTDAINKVAVETASELEVVMAADEQARRCARAIINAGVYR